MNLATFICIMGGLVASIGGYGVKRSHDRKKKATNESIAKGERR